VDTHNFPFANQAAREDAVPPCSLAEQRKISVLPQFSTKPGSFFITRRTRNMPPSTPPHKEERNI
jgi:hypothetical protein